MLTLTQYSVAFGEPAFKSKPLRGGSKVKRPVAEIDVVAVVNAENLESFKPGLRDALWYRPAINDSARMDENGDVHDLIARFPTAKPVTFDDRYPGYSLVVHRSELFDDRRDWTDVTLNRISVTPESGGTARVKVKLAIRGEGLEWWATMLNRAATITLTPPVDEPLPAEHPDAQNERQGDLMAGTDLAINPAERIEGIGGPDDGVSHDDPDGNGEDVDVEATADPKPAPPKRRGKRNSAAMAH